jgi:hypothetical protein
MAAWLHGCMAAWLHGCMAAWLKANMSVLINDLILQQFDN